MRKLLRAWYLAGLACLVGCPGMGGGLACTRHPDGTIECNVEVHRDGNHDAPVK